MPEPSTEDQLEAVLRGAGVPELEMDFAIAQVMRVFDEVAARVFDEGMAEILAPRPLMN